MARLMLAFGVLVAATLVLAAAMRLLGADMARSGDAGARSAAAGLVPTGFIRAPSGRLLPRFATIARADVMVRVGPSPGHAVRWIVRAAGMPVEILAEAGEWWRIRDHEGEEGWVWHAHVAPRRHAMVAPWNRDGMHELRAAPSVRAPVIARVRGGVVARLLSCDGDWCRLQAGDARGWMRQPLLWGVYAGERLPSSAALSTSATE